MRTPKDVILALLLAISIVTFGIALFTFVSAGPGIRSWSIRWILLVMVMIGFGWVAITACSQLALTSKFSDRILGSVGILCLLGCFVVAGIFLWNLDTHRLLLPDYLGYAALFGLLLYLGNAAVGAVESEFRSYGAWRQLIYGIYGIVSLSLASWKGMGYLRSEDAPTNSWPAGGIVLLLVLAFLFISIYLSNTEYDDVRLWPFGSSRAPDFNPPSNAVVEENDSGQNK